MHVDYPKLLPPPRCTICDEPLSGNRKVVCSSRCAGYVAGRRRIGKGTVKPYIQVRVNGKRVYLHRLVWEECNGRYLEPGEIVHHKDGDKRNNDPTSLGVFADQSEHMRHHYYDRSPIDHELGF